MKEARSAGVILYRESDKSKRRYLLLQHAHGGHWSFPKGNIKLHEDPSKAARRELFEETQINKLELLDGFQQKIEYSFSECGELIHKEVLYFLGKTEQRNISLSPEHLNYVWLAYEDALNKLTYENDQKLLRKAEEFLNSSLR